MKLNINDMPVFAAVARERGITAAARKLGQPKSSVSTAISRLEAALGVRLLERNTRRVRLTSEGEGFLKHCLMVEEQLQAAEAEMSGYLSEPRGRLSVSLTMAFSRVVVGGALTEFLGRYPGVELDVRVSNDYSVDVIGDPVDVAIKVGPLADSSLVASKLVDTPLIWVTSPAYRAQMPGRVIPGGLARHLQVLDKRYTQLQLSMECQGQRLPIRPGPVNLSNDPLMVRDMVIAGAGVGLVPALFCHEPLARGALLRLAADWSVSPVSSITAVYAGRHLISHKTRVFIEFLKELIARLE